MQLINKINLHQVLTATLLQHNKFVTTIAEQYKASGTKLLKGKPNPQTSMNFQVYGVKIHHPLI